MKQLFILAVAAFVITSCKKENNSGFNPNEKGSVEIEFDNVYNNNDLQLNTATYSNALGEEFTISTLDYFISNIKLKTGDGRQYVVPQDSSYFLIKESDESTRSITLLNVPAGDYTSFTFTVGVDSVKSTAPITERTGVLDPAGAAAGMYWTWNSGYIFLKMEGSSPVSTTADKKVYYHVGGFGGYDSPTMNNIREVTITAPFEMSARVRGDQHHTPAVHIFADAAKILNGPVNVSIAGNSMVHFSAISAELANNYSNMFNVDHIHND